MINLIIQSARATIVLALLTGIIFPLTVTAIAQLVFPYQANGSLIHKSDGTVIGSSLLGQQFQRPQYFHPRPSAAGAGYSGESSSGTNLGPTSAKLFEGQSDDLKTKEVDESFAGVKQLAAAYRQENGLSPGLAIPIDAVTRSGSGLDPHISKANALMQAPRVARARNVPLSSVLKTLAQHTESRQWEMLGEPRINVLLLNLDLDQQP